MVLSLAGLVGVVYAIKEAAAHGLTWPVVGAALLGAAALAAFVRRQLTMPIPLLDIRLFRHRRFSVGVRAGFSFTVTADVILSSVPKQQAGAASAVSAVSATAYALGAALGITLLGSIVTSAYRAFAGPYGTPPAAHESLGTAVEVSRHLPSATAQPLLDAARDAFVHGLHLASGAGAVVLVVTALAAWFVLRGQRLEGPAVVVRRPQRY